jgi:hypothetical protein
MLARIPSAASAGAMAGEQQRCLVPRRMNRRHDRDVDVAGAVAEKLRGFLLAAGRDRVDVEKERFASNMRLDRLRRFDARRRGDSGYDDVRLAHGIGSGRRTAHPDRLSRAPQLLAFGLRKQNVPGRDALDACFAQAGRDGLARFAKADETNGRLRLCHRCSLHRHSPMMAGSVYVSQSRPHPQLRTFA